jgi:hypothetical protein
MCVSASFRTLLLVQTLLQDVCGSLALVVYSDFRSMPSRLLRMSLDRSDGAFLAVTVNNQISIYLPSIRTSILIPLSPILFIQTSSTCTHISMPSRLLLRSRRRHAPMQHASTPLLSAPAAASPSTIYEPTSIPSFIRTRIAMPPRLPLHP